MTVETRASVGIRSGRVRWVALLGAVLLFGFPCSCSRHPIPRNADPADAHAAKLLAPMAENIYWEGGHITILDLPGASVTPEVLGAICDLKELRELALPGATIRDQDLAALQQLPKLSALGLQWTGITDEGVRQLLAVPSLKCVVLDHTLVTDKGLELLASKPGLTHIFLEGTAVSSEGLSRLRQALPNAHVQGGGMRRE